MKINKFFILLNLIFFIYYGFQLSVFTDEFAVKNIGFFNHAVAGLSEIIAIFFFSLALALIIILIRGVEKQLPIFLLIFLTQFIIASNFWRYVLTNSPGETDLKTITFNAIIFSLVSLISFIILIKNIKKL